MPRQKRPLAEADANATRPPAKRASKGSAAATATDENAASPGNDYDSMTKSELADLLKARGLPYSGPNKAALIQRLREADVGSGQGSLAVVPAPVTGLDFVTMCRSRDDIEDEKKDKRPINADGFEGGESAGGYDLADVEDEEDSDEDEEEGGHATLAENRAPDGKCMCKKPAKDFPGWKWVVSKRALDIMMDDLAYEFSKRDQDAHDEYHFNDFTGYGMQEVMENQAGLLQHFIYMDTNRCSCSPLTRMLLGITPMLCGHTSRRWPFLWRAITRSGGWPTTRKEFSTR